MIALATIDIDWFRQLRSRQPSGPVKFWTPTPWNVRGVKPGGLLYFLLKAPYRKIGGYGQFVSYENMKLSEAWNRFGVDNGVASEPRIGVVSPS
jgi:putative restriction endonuclease